MTKYEQKKLELFQVMPVVAELANENPFIRKAIDIYANSDETINQFSSRVIGILHYVYINQKTYISEILSHE
jgi:hypothetical protein